MEHKCAQERMLDSMSTDIREMRAEVKDLSTNVLSRLPVVEEKCKASAKETARHTSLITTVVMNIFLGVALTLLTSFIKKN